MSDPSTRAMVARIAAHESWARTRDRSARTANARQAADDRFLRQAREEFGDLPADELQRRADHLKSAHFTRLALRSAQARRGRKGQAR